MKQQPPVPAKRPQGQINRTSRARQEWRAARTAAERNRRADNKRGK